VKKMKKPSTSWVLRTVVSCEECDGSGKIMTLLRGANILTTKFCDTCCGLGSVCKTVKLSAAESKHLDKIAHAHKVAS
jgi:DnaJ-class molecular chaperone